jgi:hypothetical protein
MRISIETIDHSKQRYPTVGDWIIHLKKDEITIRVSKMGNWRYELLVGIHELVEVLLCLDRGIPQSLVDDFDKQFEERRIDGNTDEPGDDPHAPYRREHFFATSIERLLSAELGVDWKTYDDVVSSL